MVYRDLVLVERMQCIVLKHCIRSNRNVRLLMAFLAVQFG